MNGALTAAVAVVLAGMALRPAAPERPVPEPLAPAHRSLRRPAGTRSARAGRGPQAVAEWCTDLARAVRSGATLTAAVRDTPSPPGAEAALGALRLALDRGAALAPALERAAGDTDDADLQLALTVLQACAENGGPPGEPIDRAAATLRARAADLADRRTHSAQARMSAAVMTWLPVAMLAVLLVTSASVRAAVASPAGVLVVGAGGALNVVGWRWMNRIIGADR